MTGVLVGLLESLGYPVFLQGSLNADEAYPDSFFTFWNFSAPEGAFYDNDANRCVWGFWVYFYSTDPMLVDTVTEHARMLLKQNGWVPKGRPVDARVDRDTHTGHMFVVQGIENYRQEE